MTDQWYSDAALEKQAAIERLSAEGQKVPLTEPVRESLTADAAAMRKLFTAFIIAQSVLGLIVLSCLVVVVMSALA